MRKFKLKRPFSVQVRPDKAKTYQPGIYAVPDEMPEYHAQCAKRQHKGSYLVTEKVAPENKVVAPAENKARVAKKTKRRRGSRSKPKP